MSHRGGASHGARRITEVASAGTLRTQVALRLSGSAKNALHSDPGHALPVGYGSTMVLRQSEKELRSESLLDRPGDDLQ